MEIAILICCAVIIVLLCLILIKQSKPDRRASDEILNALDRFSGSRENESRMLMDQSARQGEAVANQLDRLGRNMRDSQDSSQRLFNETLNKLEEQMTELLRENREGLSGINSIVTEKMQSTLDEKLNNVSQTVVKNMSELGKSLGDNQSKQEKTTEEKLEQLRRSFDAIRAEINTTLTGIRNSNSESMDKLRRENQESLDKINAAVNEKLQKTLDDKISQSFNAVNQRLKDVYEGLGEMKTVASGVADLKNVLSNVKTRGILGEIQLAAILEEVLAPEQYGEQVQLTPDSGERVDFAVKLPGQDEDGIFLPIDSKFPGDTYSALQAAYDSGDSELVRSARKTLTDEIRRCAKSISEKYIKPPYTTNFAVMFLPFEGLYAEVVNLGLIEVLQRDFKVNIAGPSTMAAMLNSLRMGFATLAIQKKSGEVWKILGAAKTEFAKFEEGLIGIQKRLRLTDSDLDSLIGTRTRAINKKLAAVEKLDGDSSESILELN